MAMGGGGGAKRTHTQCRPKGSPMRDGGDDLVVPTMTSSHGVGGVNAHKHKLIIIVCVFKTYIIYVYTNDGLCVFNYLFVLALVNTKIEFISKSFDKSINFHFNILVWDKQ